MYQKKLIEEIITDIERYRGLVDVAIAYDESEFVEAEMKTFNDYLRLFDHFMGDDEPQEQPVDRDLLEQAIDSISAEN